MADVVKINVHKRKVHVYCEVILWTPWNLCSVSMHEKRRRLMGKGIPIMNQRRSDACLRFTMGIPIPIRRCLLSEYKPWINDESYLWNAVIFTIHNNGQNVRLVSAEDTLKTTTVCLQQDDTIAEVGFVWGESVSFNMTSAPEAGI